MVIGIDIRVLGNPVKSGIEEYAENLLPHLIKEGNDIKFKLFYSSRKSYLPDRVPQEWATEFPGGRYPTPGMLHPEKYGWLHAQNVKLYKFNYPNNILFTSSRFLNRPFIDTLIGGADVFFFPHFFLSSLSSNCKRVTTFHDLSYVHFPEHLTLRKRVWHNFQMVPEWQAKFSDKIIAVSESTKNDLINFYKVDPARIEVIYSGISLTSNVPRPFDVANTSDVVNNFKHVKNLPDRFIFFLGKLEPRKNIISIVKAFNNLKSNPKYNDVGLVIAGAKGWKCDELTSQVQRTTETRLRAGPSPRCEVVNPITFTGQLTDEEKFLYYRAADIFVYPSFFEGFGFPPLEAMSCGAPVITSRNSSLPEVVGASAIAIDPYDVNELELWITKLLDDKKLSELMVKRGIEQSSKFEWRRTAIRTLETLVKA